MASKSSPPWMGSLCCCGATVVSFAADPAVFSVGAFGWLAPRFLAVSLFRRPVALGVVVPDPDSCCL